MSCQQGMIFCLGTGDIDSSSAHGANYLVCLKVKKTFLFELCGVNISFEKHLGLFCWFFLKEEESTSSLDLSKNTSQNVQYMVSAKI